MIEYPKGFLRVLGKVRIMEAKLEEERKKLQDLCPHVLLNGKSAFPGGLSFTNCTMCGKSNYYV